MKTDLSYLEAMTEGDKSLIKELIGIFSTQVRLYGETMNKHIEEQNWEQLSKMAHKAKSTVAIMGMRELSKKLKKLEVLADRKEEQDSYASIVDNFTRECEAAISELKSYK